MPPGDVHVMFLFGIIVCVLSLEDNNNKRRYFCTTRVVVCYFALTAYFPSYYC